LPLTSCSVFRQTDSRNLLPVKKLAVCLVVLAAAQCLGVPDPVRLKYEPTEPKFLVPVSPYGREYEAAVVKILDKRWGFGTMIYETVGEFFAVSVWGKDYANYDYDHPLHNFITYLELDGASGDAKATKDVDVPIDIDFAIAVQRAWATMLLKSCYPEKSFLGADGYTAEFSAEVRSVGGVYGYTWSPSGGLTKEMVELGSALADYCKAPGEEQPKLRQNLMARLKDFEQKAAKAR
jgi:hypothetical protein